MTNKFYKIFNIHSLSLQIEWQLQLVLIKIGGKTKIYVSRVDETNIMTLHHLTPSLIFLVISCLVVVQEDPDDGVTMMNNPSNIKHQRDFEQNQHLS